MQNERRKMAGCLTLLQREDSAAFLWGGMRLFCTEKCVAIEAEARGDMCISPKKVHPLFRFGSRPLCQQDLFKNGLSSGRLKREVYPLCLPASTRSRDQSCEHLNQLLKALFTKYEFTCSRNVLTKFREIEADFVKEAKEKSSKVMTLFEHSYYRYGREVEAYFVEKMKGA